MKTRILSLLLALIGAGFAPHALAWSADGHRIVGELAERQLSPEAKAAVGELMTGEPDPHLAAVAAWADEIRPQDEWKHTAPWHYVNMPHGECHYSAARDCPDGNCVVGAINRQLAILGDHSRPKPERLNALKFVVHFIGDIHQPLHAGWADDRGGNDYQINLRDGSPDGQGTNLHGIWDYWILHHHQPDWQAYADELAAGPFAHSSRDDLPGNAPARWAMESCRIMNSEGFYPPKHVMSLDDLEQRRGMAELRIREAAERLASALNKTLGKS